MRIAMVGTRGVPARYGGFETAVEEIGQRLARSGHEVTVYCRRGNSGEDRDPKEHLGMHLVHLPAVRHRALETLSHTALAALHLALGRRHHDVVIVFNVANVFAVPLVRLRRTPVAVHVDGLEWRRAKWKRTGRRFYRWSEVRAVRTADALIADAPGIQQYYREEFGATSDLLEYGSSIIAGTSVERLAELGLDVRRYHLLVARLEPENHVHEFVEAYHRSGALLPLVVVGGTPYPTDYTRRVESAAGRAPGVRLLGGVWDQDLLDQLYAGAATYLHGQSVGGTNPSLLRAMGAGAPTIAHDNVFNRGVLGDDGVYGATVAELARAIAAADLAPDVQGEVRQRLVRRCRDRYDWDTVTCGYAELCAQLAGGRTQRGRFSGRRDADSSWGDGAGIHAPRLPSQGRRA